ncbi:MAG: winged helix-turn-helix domain-containing protein [Acutalibacteraceae bacterium]
MELLEEDYKIFEDFLSFLQKHPQIEWCKQGQKPVVSLPNMEVRLNQRKIFRDQQEIPLTKTEYDIFLYLLQNPNRVLTYTQVYERIWKEPDYGEARKLVSHHVQAIRRKLHLEKDSGIDLRCIRDVGYSLELR